MRSLSELIVLVRGGGEVGSAIAHRLFRSHFRICITEIAQPLAVSRGSCFSEAIYDTTKMVEEVVAERTTTSMEQIYRIWRADKIPVVIDPELSVRAMIKPDVLVNAMMLKRETNTRISDAPLVIGIGPGFVAGFDVHFVVESNNSNNLGRVIFDGKSEDDSRRPVEIDGLDQNRVIWADDPGVFATERNIGDTVIADEIIGYLGEVPLKAPTGGILRGILRNEVKVLGGAKLAEIDPVNDKSICFSIRDRMRAISGGVLEAILFSLNTAD